jgi:starvation-inducible DNA-binding protein
MKANKQLSENLQAVLVDLIELHIQGKLAHWNVVGINFRDSRLILNEIADVARASRMRWQSGCVHSMLSQTAD